MFSELHAYARNAFAYASVEITFYSQIENGGHQIAQPLTMVEFDNSAEAVPTLRLSPPQAQELMDQLWSCGLRPTEGTGSAGALAATQKHLEDLRLLVFNPLGIKPPTL